MDDLIRTLTSTLISTAEAAEFRQVNYLDEWGFVPPNDYIDFMKEFVEGEGPIGENSWLTLWRIDDLAGINESNVILNDIAEYFLFGKDAADTGYAFNKQYKTYHSFGLMSDFNTDDIIYMGNSFKAFVEKLYKL